MNKIILAIFALLLSTTIHAKSYDAANPYILMKNVKCWSLHNMTIDEIAQEANNFLRPDSIYTGEYLVKFDIFPEAVIQTTIKEKKGLFSVLDNKITYSALLCGRDW